MHSQSRRTFAFRASDGRPSCIRWLGLNKKYENRWNRGLILGRQLQVLATTGSSQTGRSREKGLCVWIFWPLACRVRDVPATDMATLASKQRNKRQKTELDPTGAGKRPWKPAAGQGRVQRALIIASDSLLIISSANRPASSRLDRRRARPRCRLAR